jgi:dCTP diphosphatase
MHLFVKEREWNKFHLPCNILLALLGEVGEVAECFQWKGSLDDFERSVSTSFSAKEVEHVGEEIADVIIYTTRLAEELRIDLGAAVSNRMDQSLRRVQMEQDQGTEALGGAMPTRWSACAFADLQAFARTSYQAHRHSPRYFALALHSASAKLAGLFSRRPEADTRDPWRQWAQSDTVDLVDALVDVLLCMGGLADLMGLELAKCASDKIIKNAAKYPVAAAKGSSAKYTAYISSDNGSAKNAGTKLSTSTSQFQLQSQSQSPALANSTAAVIFAGVVGTFAGIFIARKLR